MDYEWDEDKSIANLRRRGFGFEIMAGFDWSISLLLEIQWVDGEERELTVGPIGRALYTVVTADRDGITRVISLRRPTRIEQERWRREYQNG